MFNTIYVLEEDVFEMVAELCEVWNDDVIPDRLAHQHQVPIGQPRQLILNKLGTRGYVSNCI